MQAVHPSPRPRARSVVVLVTLVLATLAVVAARPAGAERPPQTAVTGAVSSTINESADGPGHCKNGNPDNNCNIYDGKQYVWTSGLPDAAQLNDGTYFFAVLAPGGQADPNDGAAKNLSDDFDSVENRTFTISAGSIVAYVGTHDFADNRIRLAEYADTPNPGGVYILASCSLAGGYPVDPDSCKYDAFKIETADVETVLAKPLSVVKSAEGAYTNTFTWSIDKTVDKTVVKQVGGGTATFSYEVAVGHDAGQISDVTVTGTIQVVNPNPVSVSGVDVVDQLSDGTVCDVTDGSDQTLRGGDNGGFETSFAYSCHLSTLPTGALHNTVTVSWPEQALDDGSYLDESDASFSFENISFTEHRVDDCVAVTDDRVGSLGEVCADAASPQVFAYARDLPVPLYECVSHDNTASFVTDDTGATRSSTRSVSTCGPAKTGAHTIGFWQNKNGQSIVTGGASSGAVCVSATWLRQYAPFQDLSPTATCAAVGKYVTTVIKSASAAGVSMNPMLKAQMLATALDTFFSSAALSGNPLLAPAPIGGVAIDLTQVCKNIATCTIYEATSSAFGAGPSRTVSELLAFAAAQSNPGGTSWYGNVKLVQELAKDTFDAINNQVAFRA